MWSGGSFGGGGRVVRWGWVYRGACVFMISRWVAPLAALHPVGSFRKWRGGVTSVAGVAVMSVAQSPPVLACYRWVHLVSWWGGV